MPHDPFAWLGKIEPEKPRNARLWPNAKGVTGLDHAPLPGEQPKAPVVAPETPMPKANLNAPTPGNLRTYLLQHGPTDRATLLDAVGYRRSYKNEATARTMLNKALREVGAVSDTPRGPLWIPNEDGLPRGLRPGVDPELDEKPVTRAPYTSPPPKITNAIGTTPDDLIRPDLAVDATRYLQASAKSGKSVVLTADMARAILAELQVDVD